MKKLTKKIAGQKITLPEGWYRAGSPIGTTIVHIEDRDGQEVWVKDLKEYEPRCQFLNAFNNGEMSFDGRWWE
jgi:hypothetical protein